MAGKVVAAGDPLSRPAATILLSLPEVAEVAIMNHILMAPLMLMVQQGVQEIQVFMLITQQQEAVEVRLVSEVDVRHNIHHLKAPEEVDYLGMAQIVMDLVVVKHLLTAVLEELQVHGAVAEVAAPVASVEVAQVTGTPGPAAAVEEVIPVVAAEPIMVSVAEAALTMQVQTRPILQDISQAMARSS
jgi:hypothetical protein